MQLYYARSTGFGDKVNFGDELNVHLWEHLLPDGFLDDDPSVIFVGIGTLLNNLWIPLADEIVVFGSGVGYGLVPKPDHRWKIYCVRGPRSAKALGIDPSLAVTDPAVLCRRIWPNGMTAGPAAPIRKRFRYSYMPHMGDACLNGKFWADSCARNNMHYIDPTRPVAEVLAEIVATEHLLCEAMHGAVIADAYRVPWTAVRTSSDILDFKWNDWCESLGMSYEPLTIFRPMFVLNRASRLRSAGALVVHQQMKRLARRARPQLSDETVSRDREQRLLDLLEECRRDLAPSCR